MIRQPIIGHLARLHYAAKKVPFFPHHGKVGRIVIVSRGKGPRNVGVLIEGRIVVVGRGNLVAVEEEA
jgi:hypothetical protein